MSTPSETSAAPDLTRRQLAFMVAALLAGVISFSLNATMLAPAYHAINTDLGPGAFVAMSTYFYLAGAIANVVLVRWSDYIGRKRVLMAILIMLCVGTVICIFAQTLPLFVVGRVLQGASNVSYALAFLIMRERLSPATFGVCAGLISAINGGVAGVDSLLGGIMVDHFGFRSIFVLILVIGVLAVAFAWRSVPADEPGCGAKGRMDWIGAALISLTVGGLNMFFSGGGHSGWLSTAALAWFAVAIAAFVGLVVADSRIARPLVAIKHLRSREAWPVIALTILVMASFMVVLGFIVPAIAEDRDSGFGLTATQAALYFLTPASLAQVILAPFVGRLAVRIGFVTVLRAGIVSAIAVTAMLALVAQNQHLMMATMVLWGVAFSMLMTAMSTLGVLQASDEEPGALPGISNASYGIGSSLGFAWAGPIVGSGTHASFAHGLWICAGIGVVALVCSLILRPKSDPITISV